jgi:peroxiredoxin
MARTPSNMLPLGTIAPDFQLLNVVTGEIESLQQLRSQVATLIMFICNHCPFVQHIQQELAKLGTDYISKGVSIIAINANDVSHYPEDSPEKMQLIAAQWHLTFPYLFDATQSVAKAYDAACTPDFYLFDNQLKCVYRGQLDDSRPGNDIPVTGVDLRAALGALLAGKPIDSKQKPSLGCNIKWKNS